MIQTPIMDLLDREGVAYRRLPHAEPVFTVETAARTRGVRVEEMVKSILLRDKAGRYVMGCVTGNAQIDPQAVRALLPPEWKRLSFATADEIRAVTGCVQGAVAPLNLPPDTAVVFDEAIGRCNKVSISSGDPRLGLELDPRDLARVARARVGRIAR
jgi:prolyl-tRNA editing enzyme YbaK/EbsC (Cys-tRNA(Pro) deacylase)